MGKSEQRQSKLTFDGGKKRGGSSSSLLGDGPAAEGGLDASVRAMFLDLKNSLAGINAKLDYVTEQLDRIKARVDDQNTRFDHLESRTSDLKDQHNDEREKLLQMERKLDIIHNKNEDLEVRSHRNNIRIIGLPESTDMGCMEDFVEGILKSIFACYKRLI
ncbi:hypothetical protein NDU88_006744 [Pleurodeles waltl]|uniref:Uncharacterized protein n=1 Tax=Pleurodeles waltl TaxID=8319 RepID=A0AAV7WBI6_PLEWA|nr:hypothetical protein NDU88_006744 [Pleurodeles waltl]